MHGFPQGALVASLSCRVLVLENFVQHFPCTVYLGRACTMAEFSRDIGQCVPLDETPKEPGPFLNPRLELERVRILYRVNRSREELVFDFRRQRTRCCTVERMIYQKGAFRLQISVYQSTKSVFDQMNDLPASIE